MQTIGSDWLLSSTLARRMTAGDRNLRLTGLFDELPAYLGTRHLVKACVNGSHQ